MTDLRKNTITLFRAGVRIVGTWGGCEQYKARWVTVRLFEDGKWQIETKSIVMDGCTCEEFEKEIARLHKAEQARLKRNAYARGIRDAYASVGMKKTRYGGYE